jgi:hypothetical protein
VPGPVSSAPSLSAIGKPTHTTCAFLHNTHPFPFPPPSFARKRDVHDPRALAAILEKAEEKLARKRHPDPYTRVSSHLTSLITQRCSHTIDPTYPGGSKWCVCHLLCFISGFFTHPASLDLEHTGNETCLCVLSSFLISFARSYIPVSPHSVPFLITKPTIEEFYLYSCS